MPRLSFFHVQFDRQEDDVHAIVECTAKQEDALTGILLSAKFSSPDREIDNVIAGPVERHAISYAAFVDLLQGAGLWPPNVRIDGCPAPTPTEE